MKKPMDGWVAAALTDDLMVVELLLRIKHAGTVKSDNPAANLPLLRWGFRQRRSRPSRLGVGVGGCQKKEADSARASPMTPLCWSGGSGSGGSTCPSATTADGFEDTSGQASCSTSTGSGSKALHPTNEISSRRFKKKKKTANVQATYEKRSTKNQSLKRIKHEYSDRIKFKTDAISKRRRLHSEEKSFLIENERQVPIETKSLFFLPDLNMTPTEDETLYGTS